MFTTALCVNKYWKQPEYLLIDEWIKKKVMLYLYNRILSNKGTNLIYAATWLNGEIMPNKRSQT